MTRALGTKGLQLTELGFGGGAIGGLYAAVGRDAAMSAMQAAWDAGMRYFDTAPFYGFGQGGQDAARRPKGPGARLRIC